MMDEDLESFNEELNMDIKGDMIIKHLRAIKRLDNILTWMLVIGLISGIAGIIIIALERIIRW